MCRKRTAAQLHHIDGDNSNTVEENLMPVCKNCHSEIETYVPFAQKRTPAELKLFRDGWYEEVVRQRSQPQSTQEAPTSTGFRIKDSKDIVMVGNRSQGNDIGFDLDNVDGFEGWDNTAD